MALVIVGFDGILVENRRPYVGKAFQQATDLLEKFQDAGTNIILKTDRKGEELDDVINWFNMRGIYLHGFHPSVVSKKAEHRELRAALSNVSSHYVDRIPSITFDDPIIRTKDDRGRPNIDWDKFLASHQGLEIERLVR